ncbi:hypothetical protein [Pseudovibrio sp. Ad37]|uniref:hypothetical protein n=1 Tax=Pseudovibrio sp. Ad37 TaxID=989422 RepID=UPI0007AEC247|nr:hypothetical protein [Pseudovibrio sp. Ad37]KZL28757.1 hypothetical protein PsAD37_00542 [Pseudovibrio sp. Ad37]
MKTPEEPAGQPRPDIAMFSVSRAELIRTYLCYAFIVLSSEALLGLLSSIFLNAVSNLPPIPGLVTIYYLRSAIVLFFILAGFFVAPKRINLLSFIGLYIGISFAISFYSVVFRLYSHITLFLLLEPDQMINWLINSSFISNFIYIPLIGYGLYQVWRAPSAKKLASLGTSSAQ